jgi:hypothetical protein
MASYHPLKPSLQHAMLVYQLLWPNMLHAGLASALILMLKNVSDRQHFYYIKTSLAVQCRSPGSKRYVAFTVTPSKGSLRCQQFNGHQGRYKSSSSLARRRLMIKGHNNTAILNDPKTVQCTCVQHVQSQSPVHSTTARVAQHATCQTSLWR